MVWVNAATNPALMIKLKPRRNRPSKCLVGKTMRRHVLAVKLELTVVATIKTANPKMAAGSGLGNIKPLESSNSLWSNIHAVHK